MNYKKDWSTITGQVKLIERGASEDLWIHDRWYLPTHYRPSRNLYDSIEEFCKVNYWAFVNDMGRNGDDRTRNAWELLDCDGLTIPPEIIRRIYCETVSKKTWIRKYYTFRKGPIRWIGSQIGNGTRGWRGGGYARKKYHYMAKVRADAAMAYDDDCIEHNITPRSKAILPNVYDNEYDTRRGNNWKNYRKTQWK